MMVVWAVINMTPYNTGKLVMIGYLMKGIKKVIIGGIKLDTIKRLLYSSCKPSEPFEVIGKIIPRYENENWTFTELLYEAPYLKSYQDDKCVGKVKLRKNWNRYAYIEDIAVCKDFRGQGIGSALINISIEWAKHKNLHGLMLETQDNNLIACKFYHNCGFKIGSVDTMLYANFENNFEKAVFWYLRF